MTILGVGERIAGKVLGDYLGSIAKAGLNIAGRIGSKVGGYVGDIPLVQQIGSGTAEEAARGVSQIPLVGKLAAAAPIPISAWQAGAQELPGIVSKTTGLGAAVGGYKALSNFLANESARGQQVRPQAFATQQYRPGTLPFTNEQYGDMLLSQQRYEQQMNLIRARQEVSMPQIPTAQQAGMSGDVLGNYAKVYQF